MNGHISMRGPIVLGLVAALAGCGPAAAAHHPGSSAASHARPVPGCAGHPGVVLGSPPAALCASRPTGDGGVLYSARYPHAYAYYWLPRAGDMLVAETYYLPNGPLGMPLAWNGRLVTLGDGCVAADTISAVHPPTKCIDAREEGRFRDMTPAEQRTVDDFWAVMRKVAAGTW